MGAQTQGQRQELKLMEFLHDLMLDETKQSPFLGVFPASSFTPRVSPAMFCTNGDECS